MLKRMQIQLLGMLCALPLSAMAGVPTGPVDLLRADFNDKALGQSIGTGGAEVGEPTQISNLDTYIEDCSTAGSPPDFVDRCLDVKNDLSSTVARTLQWEFLGGNELSSGSVSIHFDFTPSERDLYQFTVRERGSFASSFLTLRASSSGTFAASDANGSIPLANITYAAGESLDIQFDFDMDAGTSQASINGSVLYTGRAHGITSRGVGSFGIGYDSGSAGSTFRLDNLIVSTPEALPIVLDANFDDQPAGQPLGTGGASVHQPVSISPGLVTQVIPTTADGHVLRMFVDGATTTAKTVKWQFLDDIGIVPGVVAFETDIKFSTLDTYWFYVREVGSVTSGYPKIAFGGVGQIVFSDATGSGVVAGTVYQAGVRYRLRLTFDQARGVYSAWLNDTLIIEDRPHGVTAGRGIGSFWMGFAHNASAQASMIIYDLQVGASAAPDIASKLVILQEPTTGTVGEALTPTLEVAALNVFDQAVTNGGMVMVDTTIAPLGAALSHSTAFTNAGLASFPNLSASHVGVYQLRASADRTETSSSVPLIVGASASSLFSNGFEAQ